MTGLELIKAPTTTAGEIADIISEHCPPVVPTDCDHLSCRECWLAWLVNGEPPKEKGPSDEQTAPGEEGLHPNLAEFLPKEGETRKVTTLGVKLLGEFYTNERLLNYVGASVFVQKSGASYEAITKSGESLGAITPRRGGGQ